jgi:hypothetical protein
MRNGVVLDEGQNPSRSQPPAGNALSASLRLAAIMRVLLVLGETGWKLISAAS